MVDGQQAQHFQRWADEVVMPSAAEAAEMGSDVQGMAFAPGERTRDRGALGDLSGTTALAPNDADRISVRPRGAAHSPDDDGVDVVNGAPVHLTAVDGGLYTLRVERDGLPLLESTVSAPYFCQVNDGDVDPAEMFEAFADAVAPDERIREWRRLLAEAAPLTAHLLRPLNVRVLWPVRVDRDQAEVPADAVPTWDPPAGDRPVLPLRRTREGDAVPGVVPMSPTVLPVTLSPATAEHHAAIRRRHDEPLWDPAQSGDDVIVPVRLGLTDWGAGGNAPYADAVQQVLASLAGAGDVGLWRRFAARALAVLVARAVLTRLGIVAFAAAIRGPAAPIGIAGPGFWAVQAADADREQLADLCNRSPTDPLQDLLGLHRPPSGEVPNELRALGDLAADLGHDDGPQFGAPRWTDLVALHKSSHPALRPFQNGPRGLPVGTMTQCDVLVGLVNQLSLTMAEMIAPLPRPYAGLEFTYGDHDATVIADDGTALELPDVRYAGQDYADPALPRPDGVGTDLIALMQRDLWQLGLTQGMGLTPAAADRAANTVDSLLGPVHAAGRYGYRSYNDDGPDWSGALGDGPATLDRHWDRWSLLKRGHSGWAVRELQIAANVGSCAVVERLDATAPYVDRLVVQDRRDGDEQVVPITGLLDPLSATLLRRWRFMRRRSGVVIEAWCGGAADPRAATGPDGGGRPPSLDGRGPANRPHLWHDNVVNADDVMSTTPRMFVTDLSEQFSALPIRRETLGDWSAGLSGGQREYQQGPQATEAHTRGADSPFVAVTLQNLHGFEGRDSDVYDLLWPSVNGECSGYYDIINLYDRAVVSLPLFHHTLVGGSHAHEPAHVAGMVAFFDNPARTLDAVGGDSASAVLTPDETAAFTEAAQQAGRRTFGRYGVSASALTNEVYGEGYVLLAGLERIPGVHGGAELDMSRGQNNDRKRSLYQATAQWFRTWPWFWRLAGSARAAVQQQRLTYLYDVMWVRRQFVHIWGEADADAEIRYQALGAMWLRHRVYWPARAANVRTAIQNLAAGNLTPDQIEHACNNSLHALPDIVNNQAHADLLSNMNDTAMPTMGAIRGFKERLARHVAVQHAGDEDP